MQVSVKNFSLCLTCMEYKRKKEKIDTRQFKFCAWSILKYKLNDVFRTSDHSQNFILHSHFFLRVLSRLARRTKQKRDHS